MNVRFGIATAPQQVGYDDIVRVWRGADTVPEIGHAWLFDHLLPISGTVSASRQTRTMSS